MNEVEIAELERLAELIKYLRDKSCNNNNSVAIEKTLFAYYRIADRIK